MGPSRLSPPSQPGFNPIEGLVSSLKYSQHGFKPIGSPVLQPIPSAPYQSEITSVSTLGFVGETPGITYIQAPGPYPGPGTQPGITKEKLTVPVRVMAFSIYAIANGLKEVRPYQVAVALGYVKGYGKPEKEAIRSFNQVYDAIYQLEDYGVLTRVGRGRYKVNIDVALKYANAIPQSFRNRDIVALRGHNSPLGLPQHWAEILVRRQLYEEALTTATQNTTPSCLAQLLYPTTTLITASGHLKAIDLPALYLIPSKTLAYRSKVYCISAGGAKPLCSPYQAQLTRYLTPLCPICPPLSLYPSPSGPTRVVGPLADYERHLIPLSALPHNARKYELGYQLYDWALYAFHQLFNVKVKYRDGLIYITFKPRRGVVKRCLSKALTAMPFTVHRYLSLLLSALDAIADYGRSYTGLTTPELVARADSILSEALYRKPKPRPGPGLPHLMFKEIRYRVKRYDPDKHDFRWRYVRVGEAKDFSQLLALLGELEDLATERPYRLTYLEVTLAIPDPTGQAVRYLGAGYLYIYHNPNKDPEGAVRVEFRPYKHVTSYVSPADLNVMFYGLATTLTVPIDLAMRAGAVAWLG